jgi:hypothetical protein
VRRLAKTNEPCHIPHGYRRLLDQQLRGDVQATCEQVLAKSDVAELGVSASELTGRAGERPRYFLKCQRPAVVTCDDDTRQQVQTAALLDR